MQHPQQQLSRPPMPWRRLVIGCVVSLLLLAAGITLFLSTGHIIDGIWSYILPIIFTVVAILVPFWQTLFPLSVNQPSPTPTPTASPISSMTTSSPPQPVPIAATTQPQSTNQSTSQSTITSIVINTPITQAPPLPTIFHFNVPHLPNLDEFYGRKVEHIALLNRTRNGSCTSIIGPRRTGKTWLMDYLKLAAPTQLDATYHFATLDGTMPQCQTIPEFCTRVLNAFGMPFTAPQVDMDILEKFAKEQKARAITPVLCVDEFEGFLNRQAFDLAFLANLRYIAQNGLVLVVCSKSPLINFVSEHCKTSPFFNIFRQIVLKPFDKADAEDFAHKKSAQAGWNDEERAALLKYGRLKSHQQQWPPLRLQLVGQMLQEDKSLAATGMPDYYRPSDATYWHGFEQRLEEEYRGVMGR